MSDRFTLDRPNLIISLDSELAWGFHDEKDLPEDKIKCARNSWIRILDLFEEYEIPATWAVVGHLFLDRCDGIHREHPLGKDWFKRDPGGTIDENPSWFGKDLINHILDSKVNHEIGCHSFSHVEFGSAKREVAESELQLSIEAAEKMDISLESFVFPRNNVGHLDLLKEYGFTSYRGTKPVSKDGGMIKNTMRKGGIFLDYFTPLSIDHSIVSPSVDEFGLVNIPSSFIIYGFRGDSRSNLENFVYDPVLLKVKKEIDFLSENNGVLHLWFHPNDLTRERDFGRLKNILKYVKEKDPLEIKTMKDVRKEIVEKGM